LNIPCCQAIAFLDDDDTERTNPLHDRRISKQGGFKAGRISKQRISKQGGFQSREDFKEGRTRLQDISES
jgi:hypothetical protein